MQEKLLNNKDNCCIVKDYFYDNNLINKVTCNIDGKISTIKYTRNSLTGNIEKIEYPFGCEVDYTYQTNTLNKIDTISTTPGDGMLNSNKLTYNQDKLYKQIGMNTGLEFYYDNYNMLNLVHNNYRMTVSISRNISSDGYSKTVRLNAGSNYNDKWR